MLSLDCILISDFVVANLFLDLLPGTYDSTLLGYTLFILKVFLHDIYIYIYIYIPDDTFAAWLFEYSGMVHQCYHDSIVPLNY